MARSRSIYWQEAHVRQFVVTKLAQGSQLRNISTAPSSPLACQKLRGRNPNSLEEMLDECNRTKLPSLRPNSKEAPAIAPRGSNVVPEPKLPPHVSFPTIRHPQ